MVSATTENNRAFHIRNAVAFSDFAFCCKHSAISCIPAPGTGTQVALCLLELVPVVGWLVLALALTFTGFCRNFATRTVWNNYFVAMELSRRGVHAFPTPCFYSRYPLLCTASVAKILKTL